MAGIEREPAMEDDEVPASDPAFAEHFSDPLYNDLSGDFAPFGTDEGFDMLHEWAGRRDELGPATTVADLIDESGFEDVVSSLDVTEEPGIPGPGGQVDAATIVIGAGSTLLRLTGHIDEPVTGCPFCAEEDLRPTLDALEVLIRFYGSRPELIRQRDDLSSWAV